MNWLRNRLRAWLGVTDPTDMVPFAQSLVNLEKHLNGIVAVLENIKARKFETRINTLESRTDPALELVYGRIDGLDIITQAHAEELADIRKLKGELQGILQEVREVRETINDPKRVPIRTRNGSQMRQLMEQEP